MPAGSSVVHLWLAQLAGTQKELELCRALLAPDEQIAAARFKFPQLAERYTFARAILRVLLGHYLQTAPESIRLAYNPSGKPRVSSPRTNLAFNLSHSADMALYGFTRDAELGVDLERTKPLDYLPGLAARFFHPRESADLLALPECNRTGAFFTCWTRKEAYLKARGEGLSESLDSFRVSLGSENPVPLFDASGADLVGSWTLHSLTAPPGFHAALAYSGLPRSLHLQPLLSPTQFLQLESSDCAL